MSTAVKYFHWAMTDAPVLNGVAGSLVGVLDACLVNGFSVKTVDSITVTDSVATASISTGHGYEQDSVVLIAGATPSELNGQKRVLSATTNTLTFASTSPNGSASGTMSARFAPAGFEKPFSGTNLAVYRSPNVQGTRMFLRVDDNTAQNARAVGYESMTDVNTGTGPFPTNVQQAGGLWWPNASSTAVTARPWLVIADDRSFYVWVNTGTTAAEGDGFLYGFGDFNSFKSGDAYSCVITGSTTNLSASASNSTQTLVYCELLGTAALSQWVARSFTSIGGSLQSSRRMESYGTGNAYGGSVASVAYPNGADNSLLLSRTLITETSGPVLRGVLPGLYFIPHAIGTGSFSHRSKIDGQGPLAGRKLMLVRNAGGPAATTATQATSAIDITGPWR
jgi:hypothetical protein